MTCKITYELCVDGSVVLTDKVINFPVKFFVAKVNKYEVWLVSEDLVFFCKSFLSEIEAIRYISVVMKYAMKGKLVYQYCMFCYASVYYPLKYCQNCSLCVYSDTAMWYIQKFEIEKVPKHLGLFIKNVYRPSKRYQSIVIRS
jgi:hypothetical protein